MNRENAEKLSVLLMQLNAKMDDTVYFVKENDEKGLFQDYHRTAGKIMASLYLDIQKKLWEEYPELITNQMGGEYQVEPELFEPKFYESKED